MSAAIFISYRRSDAAGHAGRLHDRLMHWFDTGAVFFDSESIVPGQPFPQRLVDGIDAAKVVLVLIGPDWLDEINRRAALDETDFVRCEVEQALQRRAAPGGPAVIPVLLGGAPPPSIKGLHASLQPGIAQLCALDMHAFQGKSGDWQAQFVRLRELIAAVPGVPTPRYRMPAGAVQPYRVIEQSLSAHFSDPEHRLADLQRALEQSGTAGVVSPVALHGMGGVGKTQLALKYSIEYRDRYAGVWWLRAETDSTLQLDALDCCQLVGVQVAEGEAPALALKRWLVRPRPGAPPWLLVYDNAEDPQALRPCLPDGGGHHVLITSRNPAWSGIAKPVKTARWSAEQGADFLALRLPDTHASVADRAALRDLAAALGGLPLALEQAGAYLDETGMAAAQYTALVRQQDSAPLLLDEGRAATGYERSVLATLAIAFPRLDAAAAQLLRLLAFCAPEPVPERLFVENPDDLPAELAAAARQPLRWEKVVAALRGVGLAERVQVPALDRPPGRPDDSRSEPALQLHRLTQEVARHLLAAAEPQLAVDTLLSLLQQALPADASLPAHWPRYAGLVPHVLQVERLGAALPVQRRRLGWLLDRIATYLQLCPALYAESRVAFSRALELYRRELGEEHPDTLTSMNNLASTLWRSDERSAAVELMEAAMQGRQARLGAGHPDAIASADSLAQMRATLAQATPRPGASS